MSRLSNAEVCPSTASSAMRGRLLAGASSAALSLAVLLPAGAAFAQAAPLATNPSASAPSGDQGKGTELQTVVVTGSRIARRDYNAPSPIVTVNSQALMSQSDLQITQTLNKLPQFTPDQNLMGANAGDVQGTPNHTIGIQTLSLRGLGANRNLVLIDGQRAAPVNGAIEVDLSTIPQAMVDHIETITGGASAVYGPDAIGGVVNFVMKKNFHGLDLDMQYGLNQTGDGRQFDASVVMGTNFADDKGNLTVALERFQQDASVGQDHAWFRRGETDPTVGNNSFFGTGTAWSGSPSAAAVASILPGSNVPTYADFWFFGGKACTGIQGFGPTVPVAGACPAVNGSSVTMGRGLVSGTSNIIPQIKENQTVQYIMPALDRWSMFANGHYDINDYVTAEFQANFAQTHTQTLLTAPASFITGWTVNVPYNQLTDDPASPGYIGPGPGASHPVPGQLATLLNSRATNAAGVPGTAQPWTLSWLPSINGPMTPRSSDDTNTVYQIRAGLKGRIPGSSDWASNWTWELTGSHSQAMDYNVGYGDYSLQRFQSVITSPNYGGGQTFHGNYTQPNGSGGSALGPNFGFGMGNGVTCTSGFYGILFNQTPLSPDCAADIQAPHQAMTIMKQDVVEYDMGGDLFKLPAGTVKASIGADYRREAEIFNPDILQTDQSFLDQIVGVYPTASLNASQDVKEGYGELSIPILADLPFVKSFTFNPGARYSTYDTTQGGWTYKLLGDWEVNDWLGFVGGYNLAVRAPNLGELYLPPTEFFGAGSQYGDPCSLLSNSPFGAGGAAPTIQGQQAAVVNVRGAAGAANANAVCHALINQAGGATATNYFYNNPTVNQPAPAPQIFSWNNESGNQNLQPEQAHTYTAGVILRSPFQNPIVSRMNLRVDYYKIHIDKAIEFASIDYVYQNCLNTPAAVALSSPYCQAITRSAAFGSSQIVNVPEQNLATVDTSGVDVQYDWNFALADIRSNLPGRFSLNLVANFLGNYDTIAYPGAPVQRWYGTFGPNLSGLNGGAYSYRLNTTFGYQVGPANLLLNWRHYPRIDAAASVGPNNTTLATSAYDIFDLNAIFELPHGLQLRAGISNLLDAQPPVTAANTGQSVLGVPITLPSSGAGSTNAAFYDEFGRRFYVGLHARF